MTKEKHTLPINTRNIEALKKYKHGTWDWFFENKVIPLLARNDVEMIVLKEEIVSMRTKVEDLNVRLMKLESKM